LIEHAFIFLLNTISDGGV